MALTHASADHRPVGRPLSDIDRAHYIDEGYLVLPRFATADTFYMPAFDEYIDVHLGDRGLKNERFRGANGDVFILHARLYHSGSAIEVLGSTRRSMVAHYWRVEDMPPGMCLEIRPDRFILDPRNMPAATNFDPTFTPAAATP